MYEALALILSTTEKRKEKKRKREGIREGGRMDGVFPSQLCAACQEDLSKEETNKSLLHLQGSQSQLQGVGDSPSSKTQSQLNSLLPLMKSPIIWNKVTNFIFALGPHITSWS